MNRALLVPRRNSGLPRKPNALVRLCRLIGNYRHYRRRGICHSIAWAMARNTL